jgi:hypothetical protein
MHLLQAVDVPDLSDFLFVEAEICLKVEREGYVVDLTSLDRPAELCLQILEELFEVFDLLKLDGRHDLGVDPRYFFSPP